MKKIIEILICIVMLVATPLLTSVGDAKPLDHPTPWVTTTGGGVGVHMGKKNFGNETVTNVHWRILFFDSNFNPAQNILIGRDTSGVIPSLAPGQEITISVRVFGFARYPTTDLGFFLEGNQFGGGLLRVIGPLVIAIPQNYGDDPGQL